jgi:hypothetical protein
MELDMPSHPLPERGTFESGHSHCVLDRNDIFARASGDIRYLALNGSGDDVPSRLEGRGLRNIISNLEVRAIVEHVLDYVRTRSTGAVLPYRLDLDGERHFCEMTIAHRGSGEVELRSRCHRTEQRDGSPRSWRDRDRRQGFVLMCCVCDRCETGNGQWQPLPEAMATLRLLEREKMPRLSHGLCSSCCASAIRGADRPRA